MKTPCESRQIPADFADTGSTYVVLDPNLAEELGLLESPYKASLNLADGKRAEAMDAG